MRFLSGSLRLIGPFLHFAGARGDIERQQEEVRRQGECASVGLGVCRQLHLRGIVREHPISHRMGSQVSFRAPSILLDRSIPRLISRHPPFSPARKSRMLAERDVADADI